MPDRGSDSNSSPDRPPDRLGYPVVDNDKPRWLGISANATLNRDRSNH